MRELRRALRLAVRPCGRGSRHRCRRRVSRWIACLPCERDNSPCGEPGSPCDEPGPPCGGPAIRIPRPLRADQMIARRAPSAQGDLSTRFETRSGLIHAPSTRPSTIAAGGDRPGCPEAPSGQGPRWGRGAYGAGALPDAAAESADRAAGDAGAVVQLQVGGAAVRAAVEAVVGKEAAAQAPAVCRTHRERDWSARPADGGGLKHLGCGTFPGRVRESQADRVVMCRSLNGEWSRSGRGVRVARERVVGCSNLRRARRPARKDGPRGPFRQTTGSRE